MRWVLIRPLNQSLFFDPEIQEPLGLEYLASVLIGLGCKVLIMDSALDNLNDTKLARRAVSFNPDAVGFSITTNRELHSVEAIYAEIKKTGREIFWIAGGNYVTTEYHNAVDKLPDEMRLMKYEGEQSMKEIFSLWRNGSLHSLPRYIEGVNTTNLDELPFPQRPFHHYLKNFGWAYNLQGSRGCCSACKYCASKGMRGHLLNWRGRTPENMVSEVLHLYENYSARAFNFVDEDFLGPPRHAAERAQRFSSAIIRNKLHITFGIQVRPNSLSREVIDSLAEAGLKYVFMGIESDEPDDFKIWGRQYCEHTWQYVEMLQDKEIEINAGTLLFHPQCSYQGMRRFAGKLHQYGLFNSRTATNRLDAMPGSFFYNEYMEANPHIKPSGFVQLPFRQPEIEPFFSTIYNVLAPLEAPSMYALCLMPIIQTRRFIDNVQESFFRLKEINYSCDQQVAKCFFSLLDMFENGTDRKSTRLNSSHT